MRRQWGWRMAMVMVMVTAGDDANVKVNATYEALNIFGWSDGARPVECSVWNLWHEATHTITITLLSGAVPPLSRNISLADSHSAAFRLL